MISWSDKLLETSSECSWSISKLVEHPEQKNITFFWIFEFCFEFPLYSIVKEICMNIGLSAWVQLFFEKIFFLDQIMMIWSIQTLKNVPKHFQTRGFHHTPPRKKSEMGQNLLKIGKSSNLYRDLAWKWLSAWVQLFLKKKFFSTR